MLALLFALSLSGNDPADFDVAPMPAIARIDVERSVQREQQAIDSASAVGCGIGGALSLLTSITGCFMCANANGNWQQQELGAKLAAGGFFGFAPVSALGATIGAVSERVKTDGPLLPVLLGAAPGCVCGAASTSALATLSQPTGDNNLRAALGLGGTLGMLAAGPMTVGGIHLATQVAAESETHVAY